MSNRSEAVEQRVREFLFEHPMIGNLGAAALATLSAVMEWRELEAGATLFEQAAVSDGLYLLLYGRLVATRREMDGRVHDIGTVSPGEPAGEIGLFTGEPRSARVWALRNSEVLYLSKQGFEHLAHQHPEAMLSLVRLSLRASYGYRRNPRFAQCMALLPLTQGIDVETVARGLARALGDAGGLLLIRAETAADKSPGWFRMRESSLRHLIFVGNEDPAWRERCVQQSDCVLLLAEAERDPRTEPRLPLYAQHVLVPHHLLLLHKAPLSAGRSRAWRQVVPEATLHHHVRNDDDMARLARRLTGSAIGVVLSGGGARGFAHLGVIRALREAGTPIDFLCGVSIGAIVGAGIAADWPEEHVIATFRKHFVDSNPLADWTLPIVSLRSGASVSRRIREVFGDIEIEDLPIPFFCVSSNLTAGELEVHDRGPLWRGLRASSAIPGVLPPVLWSGQVLVDGGVIDNLPIGEMRKRLNGEIIGIDVGGNYRLEATIDETELPAWWRLLPELFGRRKRPRISQVLFRAGMVNSFATVKRQREQSKLLLDPPLEGIELLDWKAFDRAIAAGYAYTRKRLEEKS